MRSGFSGRFRTVVLGSLDVDLVPTADERLKAVFHILLCAAERALSNLIAFGANENLAYWRSQFRNSRPVRIVPEK